MPITAFYAALLALLFILLSVRVIRQRRQARVAMGDGGNARLLRLARVHGNFAEYVPMALVLMALAESLATWPWFLHLLGLALVAGRVSHAWGVSQPREVFRFRIAGMAATFTVIAIAAGACLVGALRAI